MRKQEFLAQLHKVLAGLPQNDVEERLMFYDEMIEDRMEEGLSEDEAVSAVGAIDEIIAQAADIPSARIAKEGKKPKRRLKVLAIVLLILGSPIWLSLGIAAFAVILSIYISLWSVVVSLWAVFGSLVACLFGGIAAGIVFVCNGYVLTGIAIVGAGMVCAGFSIFMFFACKAVVKGVWMLPGKAAVRMKRCFDQKEVA